MATRQPRWELVANLGDRSPLDYGGYFVYKDSTGVYTEEAELLTLDDESDPETKYTVHRFPLDRLKKVEGYLVPFAYKPSWPHPLKRYDEWFHGELENAAAYSGVPHGDLEEAFTSADPVVRAEAYRVVGEYHGWENLDSYPLTGLTRGQAEDRYRRLPPPHVPRPRTGKDWSPRGPDRPM